MYDLNIYALPTIDFVGGSTQDLRFKVFFYANEKEFDLTDYEADFAIINFVNSKGSPRLQKKMTIMKNEESVSSNGVANTLQVVLENADTLNLTGKFIYQITIKNSVTGEVDIPKQGIMYIINNIDKV